MALQVYSKFILLINNIFKALSYSLFQIISNLQLSKTYQNLTFYGAKLNPRLSFWKSETFFPDPVCKFQIPFNKSHKHSFGFHDLKFFNYKSLLLNFYMRVGTGSKFFFRWKCAVVAGFEKWCCGKIIVVTGGRVGTGDIDLTRSSKFWSQTG